MLSLFDGKNCKNCGVWFPIKEYRIVPFARCVSLGCEPGCAHEDPLRIDVYCNECVRDRNCTSQVEGNNRRAVSMNVPGLISPEDWIAHCRKNDFRCAYCKAQRRFVMD